ncbi:MAG TPA: hypothetical protein VHM19_14685, partial [Polyangiales bacterium]|nr:hypothetical protein [Polyangiales bacterium]
MATRNTAAASRLDCSIGIALALTLVSTACSGSSPKRHTHLEPVTGDQDAGHTAGMQDASDGAADAIDASFGFPDFGIDAGALQSGPRAQPTKVPAGWACRPDFALDRVCDCGCGALDAYCDPRGCS